MNTRDKFVPGITSFNPLLPMVWCFVLYFRVTHCRQTIACLPLQVFSCTVHLHHLIEKKSEVIDCGLCAAVHASNVIY